MVFILFINFTHTHTLTHSLTHSLTILSNISGGILKVRR